MTQWWLDGAFYALNVLLMFGVCAVIVGLIIVDKNKQCDQDALNFKLNHVVNGILFCLVSMGMINGLLIYGDWETGGVNSMHMFWTEGVVSLYRLKNDQFLIGMWGEALIAILSVNLYILTESVRYKFPLWFMIIIVGIIVFVGPTVFVIYVIGRWIIIVYRSRTNSQINYAHDAGHRTDNIDHEQDDLPLSDLA